MKSVSLGEARDDFALLFAFGPDPFSLVTKSEYLEDTDTGESTLPTLGDTKGEFVFVFGLESLCWLLCVFPISTFKAQGAEG
jgi:hypothetical protein